MVQEWLFELLHGTLKMFVNPILYYSIFMAAVLGVYRVKRERKNFHVRAENAYFELKQLFPLGILLGLGISIVTISTGIVVPFASIVLIGAFTFLLSLTTKIRLLSPAYTVGLTFFAIIFLSGTEWNVPVFEDALAKLDDPIYPSIAALLVLLVMAEGILILVNGKKGTSPKLITSKRGQRVGVHEAKRLWMVPVFLFIPGTVLDPPFTWWPVFTVADQTFSLLLVPFTIGFQQQIQGILPREAVKSTGKKVIGLGLFLALFAAGSYWVPFLSAVGAALAIIGRETLHVLQRIREEHMPFYFSKRNNGVIILGILPDSPASKMGLETGELITKVNGVLVNNEKAFYEALQKNAAFCKLEVFDVNGQIRFVQRALYEGEHHELGILFVQDKTAWRTEAI